MEEQRETGRKDISEEGRREVEESDNEITCKEMMSIYRRDRKNYKVLILRIP